MVEEKDLIGDLKGIPAPVVERMLYNQVAQGNKRNIEIFQFRKDTRNRLGGFNWGDTEQEGEGNLFWSEIFNYNNYKLFFNKYPITVKADPELFDEIMKEPQVTIEVEKSLSEEETLSLGDLVIAPFGDTAFKDSNRKRIYIGKLEEGDSPYIIMTRESYANLKEGKNGDIVTCKKVKKINPEPEYIELTLEDISAGKGIGVDPKLIKIIK